MEADTGKDACFPHSGGDPWERFFTYVRTSF